MQKELKKLKVDFKVAFMKFTGGKGYTNVGRSGKSFGGKGKAPKISKAYVSPSINWEGIRIGALIGIVVVVLIALAPYTGGGALYSLRRDGRLYYGYC